ncbi:MAG: bifunctional 4-hydroxy-2-oxoglutarate aldolase/2-dehydro-3-deoxy-phosphogluconate aldolase [Betaproteobacteria bacterium]|jgi:2-dehydro-3-deoxyphosphogluconate aldolase/(4S)-4-hydroxy-2-oxoglutarate aldolase|nr:bifunctional 4-hydroxy-2-oxoglutarate aldolase/2-dehydro-3-deoxy-phosphogluconate aldolase [Betaproteobacteria bacterium]
MIAIDEVLAASPVMPVIVIDRVEDAVPLARALVAGGVRVLEITLRTAAAVESVRAIRAAVPDAIVGVGTLTTPAQIDEVLAAGAVFGVSPGTTPELLAHAKRSGLPLLPGTMTPSDVMRALDAGYTRMKLFPAVPAGGIAMLKSLAGPFPGVVFCPTGGIDAASAPAFLALSNVACVGGSWLAPAARVAAGDWDAIRQLASATAKLRPNP